LLRLYLCIQESDDLFMVYIIEGCCLANMFCKVNHCLQVSFLIVLGGSIVFHMLVKHPQKVRIDLARHLFDLSKDSIQSNRHVRVLNLLVRAPQIPSRATTTFASQLLVLFLSLGALRFQYLLFFSFVWYKNPCN
jgi:hypothetical protein